jgi:2-polyprenyl-6-methoxyphenol hydroxylase-like FAD-dependent oxidoreductase
MAAPVLKVIIIGGGPVGLTTAHALAKAGIDFVVLERRPNIVEDMGASIVLSPQTLRVMGHLDLLDSLREISQEVLHIAAFSMKGKKYMENWCPNILKEYNGSYPHIFHRADLVRKLYEGLLPTHESRILPNKKVSEIIPLEGGVRVACDDGTSYEGHIVLGSDGVHSKTRHLMHELAGEEFEKPEMSPIDKDPYDAEYKTLFCSFPRLYEYAPGDFFVTHGEAVSLQLLNGRDRSWVFVYEHIKKPDNSNDKLFPYSKADVEFFAAKHGDMYVGDKLQFKDLWPKRKNCTLTDLHEGVLQRWSWGRAVLAGDACHKFTPNAGMGFNSGVQDIMALVNGLHGCVKEAGPGALPTDKAIEAMFKEYEEKRIPEIKSDCATSAMVTRLCAWPSNFYWFLDTFIFAGIPYLESLLFRFVMSRANSRGLALNFIKGSEPFQGSLPWVHPISST